MVKAKVVHSTLIDDILGETPLEVALKISFEMEWLDMNINPSRYCTDEEANKAVEFGKRMTEIAMEEVNEKMKLPKDTWIDFFDNIETEVDGEVRLMNEYRILVEPDSKEEKIFKRILLLDDSE
jgi:hypothetical protein